MRGELDRKGRRVVGAERERGHTQQPSGKRETQKRRKKVVKKSLVMYRRVRFRRQNEFHCARCMVFHFFPGDRGEGGKGGASGATDPKRSGYWKFRMSRISRCAGHLPRTALRDPRPPENSRLRIGSRPFFRRVFSRSHVDPRRGSAAPAKARPGPGDSGPLAAAIQRGALPVPGGR